MSIFHRRFTLPLAFVLTFSVWTVPTGTQNLLPPNIAEQKQVLEQAFADALTTLSKEKGGADLVAQVRALCIGSWCANKASASSDLDFTVDHPDKRVAARLKEMVNRNVDTAMKGKSHKIRVTYSGDPACVDCFTGDTGDSFIYQYAERNSIGGKNTYKPVVEDGVVRIEKADVADFWLGTGKAVPTRVNNVQTFVDESARIFDMYKTGKPFDDALAAAKYMNNIETIVKPGFSQTYGTPLPASVQLDETTKYQMREMVKIKGNSALSSAQKEEALGKLFNAADGAELESRLKAFVEKSQTYFTTTKEKMALFEDVVRRGGIAGAKTPAEALTLAETLFNASKKYSGTAFGALDIGLLVQHYVKNGADKAFFEQLALTGAMHASVVASALPAGSVGAIAASSLPPAALIAMLGAIEKEVVRAAGEAAVTAIIFDPINDPIVELGYNPANEEFSIFTAPFSPFRGYSQASVACKYMGDRLISGDLMVSELEPRVAEDVIQYVDGLSGVRSSRLPFAWTGPANISNKFLPRVMADLAASRRIWQAIGYRETLLSANATLMFPPSPALQIWANGAPLRERSNRAFRYEAPVGKELSVTIAVTREFAREIGRHLPPEGSMQKHWCAVKGDLAAYLRWEKTVLAEQTQFEPAPDSVHVGTAVKNAAGWRVTSTLPVRSLGSSTTAGTGEANILGGGDASNDGRRQFATAEYRVAATPLAQAKTPVSIDVGFRLKGTALLESIDESYAFSLTVTPTPAVPPPPAPTSAQPPPPAPVAQTPTPSAPPPPSTPPSPTPSRITTASGNPVVDACVKAARQELEGGRQEFEHWKSEMRGKTPAPFVCSSGSRWWKCLPDNYAKIWKAVDGSVLKDKFDYDMVPECEGVWQKGTNTQFNECVWPVYLGKLEVVVNRKIAACEKR